MNEALRLVLDIGKTTAKLSAWTAEGNCTTRLIHPCQVITSGDYHALDIPDIEEWLIAALRHCNTLGRVSSIIPVGHGAAAAILRDHALALPVMDYEFPIPAEIAQAYSLQRDNSTITGSPRMHSGLNLGCQLYYLKHNYPELLNEQAQILPWPQFWAWRLSGTAVCEVSSLGCHSDLWFPAQARPSPMAQRLGFAAMLPRIAWAGEVVGYLSNEWQDSTGLSRDVAIYAGLHDSNAALHAARGRNKIAAGDATVLSTGTWFVTMRVPDTNALDWNAFAAQDGCLINMDPEARPVPTALFMGGREFEELVPPDTIDWEDPALTHHLEETIRVCLEQGIMALPCWQQGTGFYPDRIGCWLTPPNTSGEQTVAGLLYLALMADRATELVGSRRLLVIDGRFANIEIFTAALAALRPDMEVVVANADNDVALGAL